MDTRIYTLGNLNEEDIMSIVSLLQTSGNNTLADNLSIQLKTQKEEELGRTTVIWLKNDINNEFHERYDRYPTDEELNDIINNYLYPLQDVGSDGATEQGWSSIYSSFEDYEKDHPVEVK